MSATRMAKRHPKLQAGNKLTTQADVVGFAQHLASNEPLLPRCLGHARNNREAGAAVSERESVAGRDGATVKAPEVAQMVVEGCTRVLNTYKERQMVGQTARNYQEDTTKEAAALPLLDYATQDINRLVADIAHEIANLNGFVDGVRGPRPELCNATSTSFTWSGPANNVAVSGNLIAPPNRGDALREAVRALQVLRNDTVEAVARLSAI